MSRRDSTDMNVATSDELSGPHGKEGTHTACDRRLEVEGGKARCCYCVPHGNCELITPELEPIQNVWPNLRIQEGKVSNDALADLLAWAYKQGFLDAAQVLTEAVKSLDEAKIRAQLLASLEELSGPATPDKPEVSEGADVND